jgi:hypothetical protein
MYYIKVNLNTIELKKETRDEIATVKAQFEGFLTANGLTATYETGEVKPTFDAGGKEVGAMVVADVATEENMEETVGN